MIQLEYGYWLKHCTNFFLNWAVWSRRTTKLILSVSINGCHGNTTQIVKSDWLAPVLANQRHWQVFLNSKEILTFQDKTNWDANRWSLHVLFCCNSRVGRDKKNISLALMETGSVPRIQKKEVFKAAAERWSVCWEAVKITVWMSYKEDNSMDELQRSLWVLEKDSYGLKEYITDITSSVNPCIVLKHKVKGADNRIQTFHVYSWRKGCASSQAACTLSDSPSAWKYETLLIGQTSAKWLPHAWYLKSERGHVVIKQREISYKIENINTRMHVHTSATTGGGGGHPYLQT